MSRFSVAWKIVLMLALLLAWGSASARAHFQVLRPEKDVLDEADGRTVNLEILFTHPMEQGPVMEMGVPRQFGVLAHGKKTDLSDSLVPWKLSGKSAYKASMKLSRPGDHVFYLEPAPYWEPAEGKMIVHYTKVVVGFMGAQDGWDQRVALPVEIEPLVRPYGLWTGNTFRGIVLRDGKPVPLATIEVEYYNEGGRVKAPGDAFVTQVIKADAAGVFAYSIPRAGWWGFAALVDGPTMPGPEGKPVPVELGGLIWVKTVDMK